MMRQEGVGYQAGARISCRLALDEADRIEHPVRTQTRNSTLKARTVSASTPASTLAFENSAGGYRSADPCNVTVSAQRSRRAR